MDNMETPTKAAEAPVTSVSTEHLEMTPGTCGGKPRIKGRRITVEHIAIWHERMAMSVHEIANEYEGITLADIYAALSYYWDHREQIDAEIKADEEFVEKMRNGAPSIFEKVRQRNAKNDSVPPG